jgi:hypothetical protein
MYPRISLSTFNIILIFLNPYAFNLYIGRELFLSYLSDQEISYSQSHSQTLCKASCDSKIGFFYYKVNHFTELKFFLVEFEYFLLCQKAKAHLYLTFMSFIVKFMISVEVNGV